MRRLGKYLRRSLLAVIALGFFLFLILQTSWFRSLLVDRLLEEVNASIHGRIEIGELRGNLYSAIDLRDIRLFLEEDTVAVVRRIALSYDPVPFFSQEVMIHSLEVDSPSVFLRMMPDSVLNIVHATKGKSADPDPPDSGMMKWSGVVESFVLRGVRADRISEQGVTTLRDGLVRGAVRFSPGFIHGAVDSLSFALLNPDVRIRHSRFTLTEEDGLLSIRDLTLLTEQNAVQGAFTYDSVHEAISFDCETAPFHVSEFVHDVDPRLANFRPLISSTGTLRNDSLMTVVDIREGTGEAHLDGVIGSVSGFPSYRFTGSLRGVDFRQFNIEQVSLSPAQVRFTVDGKGTEPGKIRLNGFLELSDAVVADIIIDYLMVNLKFDAKSLSASVSGRTNLGTAAMNGTMIDYSGEQQYELDGTVNHLNLIDIAGMTTDISASFMSSGRLNSFEDVVLDFRLVADSVRIDTLLLDRFRCSLGYHAGVVTAESLLVEKGCAVIRASGVVDTSGNGSLMYDLQIADLSSLAKLVGINSLSAAAVSSGLVIRKTEGIELSARLSLAHLVIDDRELGEIDLSIAGTGSADSLIRLRADDLVIVWNDQEWGNPIPCEITLTEGGAEVGYFGLQSGRQSLEARGVFEAEAHNDFTVAISHLEVAPLAAFATRKKAAGVLDADIAFSGRIENPELCLRASLREAALNDLPVPDINLEATIRDSVVDWRFLAAREGRSASGSGLMPVRPRRGDDFGFLDPDRPFAIHMETSTFDLATLAFLEDGDYTVEGFLDVGVDIGGTIRAPDIRGSVTLRDGAAKYPRLGIDYQGIRFALNGDGREMALGSFSVAGGKGTLTGQGGISIHYEDSLRLQPDFRFTAKDFDALTGPIYSATIDGTIDVSGEKTGRVIVDGNLTVKRSRIAIQSIQGSGSEQDYDPPLLMIAAGRIDTMAVAADSADQAWLPPFTGTMKISIPRATWLRGPRLNMELSGDVTITSNEEKTILNGFLGIEQGTYEFYARKFVVVSGRIDFDGGEKIDPTLFVEVEYLFNTDGTDNRLTIIVRGNSSHPKVEFFHNRSPISESDAISYIVFGRKGDDLNYGQKSTVSDLGNALAMDLAANMINSQLSSTVGSALGLDVVRISGEDNWNKAVLTAGKYVTDDVFVAYERGITQSGSSGVAYESARLEYYLFRFLYLHLIEATDKTSGVDLFLKFD